MSRTISVSLSGKTERIFQEHELTCPYCRGGTQIIRHLLKRAEAYRKLLEAEKKDKTWHIKDAEEKDEIDNIIDNTIDNKINNVMEE